MKEIELKLLSVTPQEAREKLTLIGAVKVFDERLYKRIVFFKDAEWQKTRTWIRLRDEVEKVTLTYKRQENYSVDGMEEIGVDVGDFEATRAILNKIGLKEINYQENKREEWKTEDAIFEIDTWPLLDTYMKIEASSDVIIQKYIKLLGLEDREQMFGGTGEVYMRKLGINVDDYPVLTFDTKI